MNNQLNVTASQTWGTDRILCGNLNIESGATLTIPPTKTTTIKNGGKLILSGGVIDNGNIIAQNGSELQIINNGKIYWGSGDELNIELGAVCDYTCGEIFRKI